MGIVGGALGGGHDGTIVGPHGGGGVGNRRELDAVDAEAQQAEGDTVEHEPRTADDGDEVLVDEARVALGMHEVHLPVRTGGQGGRIPVSGGGVVHQRHVGTAEGQRARADADGEELAGIAAGGTGAASGCKGGDGHQCEKESAVHGQDRHCTVPQ